MKVVRQIHRFAATGHGILGRLGPWCVLEEEWLDNRRNVSAIPAGTYRVEKTWSPAFGRETWQIMDVRERTGIRIHPLNTEEDTEGCIGLGMSFGAAMRVDEETGMHAPKIALLDSVRAHEEFEDDIQAALEDAGQEYWTLVITEA